MRSCCVSIGCAAVLTVLAHLAGGQAASDPRTAHDLEQRDGRIADPAIVGCAQHIENRIASACNARPVEIRITRSSEQYASLMADRVLYVSAGLLQRVENEGELAGLLAHELAHIQAGTDTLRERCVLQSKLAPPGSEDARERELQATESATGYLRIAGYDPAAVLDLLSKLAYEHPSWAKAIVSDDMLELRVKIESDPIPPGGYRIGSSEFAGARALLETALSKKR